MEPIPAKAAVSFRYKPALFIIGLVSLFVLTSYSVVMQEIHAQSSNVELTAFAKSIGVVPEGISNAFKTGNSEVLADYFSNNVELVVLDKEDVYSKNQAEIVVKNFFSSHRPYKFVILHQGGRESSKYAIGNLMTSKLLDG